MRALCTRTESCAARLRHAAGGSDLPPGSSGLGPTVEEALALRRAVSVALASFGVRRASEIAALTTSGVEVDLPAGVVELRIRTQKDDPLGVGQLAHMVALPDWRGACPARLLADWLWSRDWQVRFRNQEGRLSAPPDTSSLFVGLVRARFGLCMAPSGIAAAWGKCFGGRNLSPRKGGARLYVVNGMAREATQELGGWKSPAVLEGVYDKVRPEDVPPEMRAAAAKACTMLEVSPFVEDLDWGLGSCVDEVLGSVGGAAARIWFHRFNSPRESPVPAVLLPIRGNFLVLMGRRVRPLNLSDPHKRANLLRAREFRVALRAFRGAEPSKLVQVRERKTASRPPPGKRPRKAVAPPPGKRPREA